MFKKLSQLLEVLSSLANRPYLLDIKDDGKGVITFQYVKDDNVYEFQATRSSSDRRTLN